MFEGVKLYFRKRADQRRKERVESERRILEYKKQIFRLEEENEKIIQELIRLEPSWKSKDIREIYEQIRCGYRGDQCYKDLMNQYIDNRRKISGLGISIGNERLGGK